MSRYPTGKRIEAWANHRSDRFVVSTSEIPLPGCEKCGLIQPYFCWIWWSQAGDHLLCTKCYDTIRSGEYTLVKKATRITY